MTILPTFFRVAVVLLCLLRLVDDANAQAPFDDRPYKPLDLNRAAREQWGAGATVVKTRDHLYGWSAKVGASLKPLDLRRAVRTQYGGQHVLVAVGITAGEAGSSRSLLFPSQV